MSGHGCPRSTTHRTARATPTGVGDRDSGPVAAQGAAHTARWPEAVRTVHRSLASGGARGTTPRDAIVQLPPMRADARRARASHQRPADRGRPTVACKTSRPSSRRADCTPPAVCPAAQRGTKLQRTGFFTTELLEKNGNENATFQVTCLSAGGEGGGGGAGGAGAPTRFREWRT